MKMPRILDDDYFAREEAEKKHTLKLIWYGVFGAIAFLFLLIILFGTFYTISAGERGVLLTFGNPNMVSQGQGLHFKIPIIQQAIIFDVKTQKYEADLTSASRDLQDVKQKIAINYHILPEQVPTLFTDIGVDYAEKIIYPYEQETNKAVTSQYTAEELITRREEVREKMLVTLKDKLAPRGIIVEEVSILNFEFSPAFTTAIEQKVTAEQLKLKADNDLKRIEVEAQQKITSAKAEAESIRIQSEALKMNTGILTLRQIEKWDGVLPKVMCGSNGINPFINVNELIK